MADNKADQNKATSAPKPASAIDKAASDPTVAQSRVNQETSTDSGAKLTGDSSSPDNTEKSPAKRSLTLGTGEGQVSPATANPKAIERAEVDESDAEWVRSGHKEPVFNPNSGLGVRVGGPFMDVLEMEDAERRRAVVEGREPDYTNMAGSAGVPLWTAGQVANAYGGGHPAVAQMVTDNKDNDGLGPVPVTEVDLVGYGATEVFETKEQEQEAMRNYDNRKITSHDNKGVVFSDPHASQQPAADGATKVDKTK